MCVIALVANVDQNMAYHKHLGSNSPRTGGRFVDVDDVLLSLFNGGEPSDPGRWAEVFGHARPAPSRKPADSFIARAIKDHIELRSAED